jgi:hypothetical protein
MTTEFQTYGAWLAAQRDLAVWDREAAAEKSHWLVVPHVYCPNVAEIYQESNWCALLKLLEQADPSGEQYEMQQWSHWATPYCQIIVAPDSTAHTAAVAAMQRLEDYPLLDENDFSERESEQQYENIHDEIKRRSFERNGEPLTSDQESDLASEICQLASDTEQDGSDFVESMLAKLGWAYCDDDMTWRLEAETEETA